MLGTHLQVPEVLTGSLPDVSIVRRVMLLATRHERPILQRLAVANIGYLLREEPTAALAIQEGAIPCLMLLLTSACHQLKLDAITLFGTATTFESGGLIVDTGVLDTFVRMYEHTGNEQ